MAYENFQLWNSTGPSRPGWGGRGGYGISDINVLLKNEELRKRELENERAVAPNYGPTQARPNPTGEVAGAAPSGMGGRTSWQEPGIGYATGLVPPGTGGSIPVYDRARVNDLAQATAAPAIRKLRDQVQQVQGGVYDNPNVKALTLRQALEGYGAGLDNVVSGAQGTAAGMYNQEYQPQVESAMQSQRLASIERENRYNRSFQAWQKTGQAAGSTNSRGLPIPAQA